MPLNPGDRLGPYAVESPLGADGMGEVYRATDTRLDRMQAPPAPAPPTAMIFNWKIGAGGTRR